MALPKIFGTDGEANLVNFYGLDCQAVRNDFIEPDFLDCMYRCYEWDTSNGKELINTKNYKYKKGVPSLLPHVVLRLFHFVQLPARLKIFRREINIEEEIEFVQELDFSSYKQCLNSDITILIGVSLLKNTRLQSLNLVNLNLYNIDV